MAIPTKAQAVEILRGSQRRHERCAAVVIQGDGRVIYDEKKRCTCGAEEHNTRLRQVADYIEHSVPVEAHRAVIANQATKKRPKKRKAPVRQPVADQSPPEQSVRRRRQLPSEALVEGNLEPGLA